MSLSNAAWLVLANENDTTVKENTCMTSLWQMLHIVLALIWESWLKLGDTSPSEFFGLKKAWTENVIISIFQF